MSPASKSKSKDKSTPRSSKEQSKVSVKPSSVHANGGTGTASAYNPVLGTFHTLEISSPSLVSQSNGRFRTIDDPDDHPGNSPGTTAEYDSLSNNGSCSGESEDQKEKQLTGSALRIETIPGCDNDKRDKIRQKNERKHQRQRERRAQELHERCNAFLTSRKLETLSHQLEAMGFPADRATMAIIINEGRMEESVAWLLHEEEEDYKQQVMVNLEDKSHIKVDISDELAKVAEFEVKHKCTKQDVERAIVACEGDLLKAEDSLRSLKQAASAATPKPDESFDSAGLTNKIAAPANPVLIRSPIKGTTSTSVTIQQQRRDEKEFNYSKTMVSNASTQEFANRNLQQAFKKMQLKPTDWSRVQSPGIDKRWSAMSSAPSSVSYPPLASPVQVSGHPLKSETQLSATMVGHEVRTVFQAGASKEPSFIVMRRPKQQNLSSSSIDMSASPPAATAWYPNGSPGLEFLAAANGGLGHNFAGMGSTGPSLQQLYSQSNLHPMPSAPADMSAAAGWSSQSWNASGTTLSSLTIPSSLGLFTSWGSSGSSSSTSQNDWNTSGMTAPRDYTSIDWSLDLTSLRPLKNDMESDSWSTMFMGGNAGARPLMNVGGGVYLPGLQEGSSLLTDPSVTSNSHEWTNPFEGSDLFRVPRQYVTSPSSL